MSTGRARARRCRQVRPRRQGDARPALARRRPARRRGRAGGGIAFMPVGSRFVQTPSSQPRLARRSARSSPANRGFATGQPSGELDVLPAARDAGSSQSGKKLARYWTVGRSSHRNHTQRRKREEVVTVRRAPRRVPGVGQPDWAAAPGSPPNREETRIFSVGHASLSARSPGARCSHGAAMPQGIAGRRPVERIAVNVGSAPPGAARHRRQRVIVPPRLGGAQFSRARTSRGSMPEASSRPGRRPFPSPSR